MTAAGSCSMGWHACQINASMNSLARLTIRHLWGYEHIQLTDQPLPQVAKKSSRVITITSSIQYIRTCSPQLYTNWAHWNTVLSFWRDHVQQCRHQTEVNPNTHVLYCCSQVPTYVRTPKNTYLCMTLTWSGLGPLLHYSTLITNGELMSNNTTVDNAYSLAGRFDPAVLSTA